MSDPNSPDYNPFFLEMGEYAISEEADESWGTVHVDGKPVPTRGGVGMVNLATLAQRLTFGDYSLASDHFLSVWVFSDGTGGGQVLDLRETSHSERYNHATSEMRFPRVITQPLRTYSYTVAGNPHRAFGVGDFFPQGGTQTLYWAAFDTALCKFDPVTQAFIATVTLAAEPVAKGLVYDDLLWIPEGSGGFDVWDGNAGAVTHNYGTGGSAITPISLLEWDDRLLALEHDGQISEWDGFSWESKSELRYRGNATPRSLQLWWNQQGEPTVYLVTSRDAWVIDPLLPKLMRTGLRFPIHPDHGLGAAPWRDDAMYVSVGVGLHQLSRGGTISAMGLDRDDGLPSNLRGRIVDLEPEYNGMLALVEGIGTVTVGSDDELDTTIEETMIYGDSMVVPESSTSADSTLQRWTGVGWHTVWQSVGIVTGTPTNVQVSEGGGDYQLFWGHGGTMYSQKLRRTFYNPRQGAQLGVDSFATESILKTGRFDAGLTNFHKLASHIEIHLDQLSAGEVDVYYYNDHFEGRKYLGTVSGTGQKHLMFDPDDDGWPEGDTFHWIELEYVFRSASYAETVIVNWVSLYFIVVPLQTRSWRFSVPLHLDEKWTDRGPREIADHFDELAAGERFVTFKHRDRTYRARLAQTQGTDATGDDLSGDRTVALIEITPQGMD